MGTTHALHTPYNGSLAALPAAEGEEGGRQPLALALALARAQVCAKVCGADALQRPHRALQRDALYRVQSAWAGGGGGNSGEERE